MRHVVSRLILFLAVLAVAGCSSIGQKLVDLGGGEEPAACPGGEGAYQPAELPDVPEYPSWPDAVWENSSVLALEAAVQPPPAAEAEEPAEAEGPAAEPEPEKPGNGTQKILDEALEICGMAQEFWQKGELEKALESLDQAYALILSVDTGDDPQFIQQKDDLRYLISRRTLEIYASRHAVATGNHNAIPLVENDYVKKELERFTGPEKYFFLNSYRRSGRYRPLIARELKAAGLPEELSWLPLIESGFKVKALSRARALGPWQFIASTGYKFGLSRNLYIDERMDPVKSTIAAIAYLKELHQIFGDWTTVLAAYNCGEGRVLRVIRSNGVNYLDNFWDLYERLPQETARYVPRFLAALLIIKNPEKYGMDLPEPEEPLEYETLVISRQMHLKDIARSIGVDAALMEDLNPELRHQITPAGPYTLRVPPGKKEFLSKKLGEIPVRELPRPAFVRYKIRRGDSLSAIAGRFHTSVAAIQRANGLSRKDYIVAGRVLKIPMGRGYVAPVAAGGAVPAVHEVRRGDSLWTLARRYGTTVGAIQRANGLTSTRLVIGQELKIPGGKELSPGARTYVVRIGDCPSSIAKEHGMSLERFLAINGLSRQSMIYPGQRVSVD
ncbi:MAG: LysM peptidoglycan-binding domain-containing protein [Deltaproteobacteria bacterium]|nr:LysM peptidoglycan-binding domain-containing protein [Deltaproteobacteria bacterium]